MDNSWRKNKSSGNMKNVGRLFWFFWKFFFRIGGGGPVSRSCRTGASSSTSACKKRKRVATVAQRRAANIRERRRMFNLNEAFDKLRRKVPTFAYEKRLSRIETLRLAITYISFMDQVIRNETKTCSTSSSSSTNTTTTMTNTTTSHNNPIHHHHPTEDGLDVDYRESTSWWLMISRYITYDPIVSFDWHWSGLVDFKDEYHLGRVIDREIFYFEKKKRLDWHRQWPHLVRLWSVSSRHISTHSLCVWSSRE